jgi:hypothetical protein
MMVFIFPAGFSFPSNSNRVKSCGDVNPALSLEPVALTEFHIRKNL